jgi:hypothetical protein
MTPRRRSLYPFPLSLRGVTLLLHVRNVTADDFYNDDIPRIDLTSETLTWDPSKTLYEEQENRMTNHSGAIVRDAAMRGPDLVVSALHSMTTDLADILHDCNFHSYIQHGYKPEWSHTNTQDRANRPLDPGIPVDDIPRESQMDCPKDNAA